MPALTDPTTWRKPHFSFGYLYILKPDVVYSARVNQASFIYPLAEVTYDTGSGTLADVKLDQMIIFGTSAGANDLGISRIRKLPDATTFFIGWSSRGKGWGEVDLQDDAFITVLDLYPIMMKPYRLDPDTGEHFKDFDVPFSSGDNTNPVAIAGVHFAGFVDEGTGLITVDFDGSASYVTEPGTTISAYAWTFPGGTPASAATSTVTGVTFPAGKRHISLRVEDSNARAITTRRLVVGCERTGVNAPISEFVVTQDRLGQDGHRMSFEVHQDLPESDYPDGTMVIYFEEEFYDGIEGSLTGPAGREHIKFVGYANDIQSSVRAHKEGLTRGIVLNCVDFLGMLQRTRGLSQELNNVGAVAPSSWTEIQFANLDRYLHYLVVWHVTLLTVTDFIWSGQETQYPFTRLGSDAGNVNDQMQFVAKAIAHLLTADMRGRVLVKPDPMLADHPSQPWGTRVQRTTVEIVNLQETDWSALEWSDPPPQVGQMDGEGIVASAVQALSVFCKAPDLVPSQGITSPVWGSRLVSDQGELNAQTGHAYARANPETGLWTITLVHGGDAGIEPGLMEWITLTISAQTAAQRGLNFTDARFLPLEVNTRHNPRTGAKLSVIRAEKETIGKPAVTYILPQDSGLQGVTDPLDEFDPYVPGPGVGPIGLTPSTNVLAIITTTGIARSFNLQSTPPTWDFVVPQGLNGGEAIADFTVDAFSPRYRGTGNQVNGWLATNERVGRITDIFGSTPVFTAGHTWANANTGNVAIASERGQQNFVVAAQFRQSGAGDSSPFGTFVVATTDGVNWSSQMTLSTTDSNNITQRVGAFVSGRLANTAYVGACVGAVGSNPALTIFRTTNGGGSWIAWFDPANSGVGWRGAGTSLHVPWAQGDDSLMYYSTGNPGDLSAGNKDIVRATPATDTRVDITKLDGATVRKVPRNNHGISSDPNDPLRIIWTGEASELWVSSDGGDTAIRRDPQIPGAASSNNLHLVDANTIYVFRLLGIKFSSDFGQTYVDKTGDLGSVATGNSVNICGG